MEGGREGGSGREGGREAERERGERKGIEGEREVQSVHCDPYVQFTDPPMS